MTSPRVSIVVPAYNCEAFVGRTLDSVMAQSMPDWELVVLDDGSTDRTSDVAECYAERDQRIRVVRTSNGGVARARNHGYDETDRRSEFVTFLDHDDLWLPDCLASLIGMLDDRSELVSAYGLARCIDIDDQPYPGDDLTLRMRERFEYRGRRLVAITPDEPTTFAGMIHHNYPGTPGLHLVRRYVMDAAGGFDPDTCPADDWDMALRVSREGPIGFLDRVVLEWRRHPEAQSATSPSWRRAYYRVRAKSLTAPTNTTAHRRLARLAYVAACRAALDGAMFELRRRHLRDSARGAARAAYAMFSFGTATTSDLVQRMRSGVVTRVSL